MIPDPDDIDDRSMARRAWDVLSQWAGDFPDHETAILAGRRLRAEGVPVASVSVELAGKVGELVAVLLDGTEVRFPGDGAPEGPRIADADLSLDDVPVMGCDECERIGRACPEHEDGVA